GPSAETIPAAGVQATAAVEVDLSGELDAINEPHPQKDSGSPVSGPVSDPVNDLDAVFAAIRVEAPDGASVEAEQSLEHGRALHRAGQPDAAIASLRVATRSPALRFAAASLVGRILRETGKPREAVEWLERAAEAPPPTPGEGYDL